MVVYFHLGNRLINPLIDIDTVATLKMALFTFRLKWTLSSICWYLSCYWLFLFSTSVYCQLLQIEPFPASCCFFIFISSIRLIIYLKWPMIAGFKLLTSILLSLSLSLSGSATYFFKLNRSRPLVFSLYSFQYSWEFFLKNGQWLLDSNCGPLVLEATALQTAPISTHFVCITSFLCCPPNVLIDFSFLNFSLCLSVLPLFCSSRPLTFFSCRFNWFHLTFYVLSLYLSILPLYLVTQYFVVFLSLFIYLFHTPTVSNCSLSLSYNLASLFGYSLITWLYYFLFLFTCSTIFLFTNCPLSHSILLPVFFLSSLISLSFFRSFPVSSLNGAPNSCLLSRSDKLRRLSCAKSVWIYFFWISQPWGLLSA